LIVGPWAPALKRARNGLSALAACLVLVVPGPPAQADNNPLEYAVKATYLYKFPPFVEWPDEDLDSPSRAFDLCVVGDDPFGNILDRAVRGQQIGGRPIELRRLRTASRDSRCHLMYIAGSAAQSVAEALDAVRGTPVLTVTDAAQDPGAKGIVHFVIRENRVRFEIDDRAAAENGLLISSKVLSLAVSVRPRA
jgi:hypothetical protein